MHYIKMEFRHPLTENTPNCLSPHKQQILFTPFQQERDSMNRLIRSKHPLETRNNRVKSSTEGVRGRSSQKETAMNKKIAECFRHQNIFMENCQPKKRKVNRKTIIQLVSEQPRKLRPSTHEGERKREESRQLPHQHLNRFSKTHSVQLFRGHKKTQPNLKKIKSTMLPRPFTTTSPQKGAVNSPQSPKRVFYFEPKINVDDNMDKYPQLSRQRRMREMSVKLNIDIEETHGRFLDKMISSKQLAFELRKNLDKIDGFL